MKTLGGVIALAAAMSLAGCTGGAATALGFGPRCDPRLNREISVAEQYTLYTKGDPLSDIATDSSDAAGALHEYDTCRGIASVNFQNNNGEGDFTITPLAVGQCQMTVDDGQNCVTSTVVVQSGFGAPHFVQRRPVTV